MVSGTFKDCKLLNGERGHLIPNHYNDSTDAFIFVGMFIAHAVRNGQRGLAGLSRGVVQYLVRGCATGRGLTHLEDLCLDLEIDDVDDTALRNILHKVSDNSNLFYTF